ncbi:hypothetical protein LTR36_009000 [Oleoguttula mirabilis]|uniref:Uncharacterized protein n=1 Tax=Oleoguttula mirabilis TaxID=1507867 RepID=A0AAV9J6J5_9PEZI|nr:hypothetical protein LTR36_009000 [Oleoguttula mirabilis]
MAQQSTYNESEIVHLVSDIYTTLTRLGHFEDNEIIWAPPEGHALDFPQTGSSLQAFGNAHAISQLPRPIDLATSWDIDKLAYYRPPGESRLDMANALPTELLLLQGEQSDDPCLVLDIEDNTIRLFDQSHAYTAG